jgi:DNA-binding transcriptional LysR family regulator
MNLRHIEIFHAVYVNGSVSAAARALNVSQPSVSKMLRHAESLLGFPLFQRTSGGLVPTQDAHVLFTEVSEIQDRVYALREAGRNLRRGVGGVLRISALPSLALDAIPTAVARFLRTHNDVKFDLQTCITTICCGNFTSGKAMSRSPIRCRPRRRSAIAGSAKASWSCSIARRTCPMLHRGSSWSS